MVNYEESPAEGMMLRNGLLRKSPVIVGLR